jgi:hypothetical protein
MKDWFKTEEMKIPTWIVVSCATVVAVLLLPRLMIIALVGAVIYWSFRKEASAFLEKHTGWRKKKDDAEQPEKHDDSAI